LPALSPARGSSAANSPFNPILLIQSHRFWQLISSHRAQLPARGVSLHEGSLVFSLIRQQPVGRAS
ncbi:hypothetical protein K0U00_38970, partial [Paenibacillus sepulcri]|nr:hypothetical protein [Paenibacillus sepulcri]